MPDWSSIAVDWGGLWRPWDQALPHQKSRATETRHRNAYTNPAQAQGQSFKAEHALRVKHVYTRNLG
ncbi:MAG: hypothetical protein VW987_10685, partial [Alphaproteobacteria bacterium]